MEDRMNRYVDFSGFKPHYVLKELYDAAPPTNVVISLDEAAIFLHNTIDKVYEIKGKNLYIDNIFAKKIDSTAYNNHYGDGLMQYVYHRLLWKVMNGKYE